MLHSEAIQKLGINGVTYEMYRALEWLYMQGECRDNSEFFNRICEAYPTPKKRLDYCVQVLHVFHLSKIILK